MPRTKTPTPKSARNPKSPKETRVLVLTPHTPELALLDKALSIADLNLHHCAEIGDLCVAIEEGAGTIVVSDQALNGQDLDQLKATLSRAPAWSDLPILMLTGAGGESRRSLRNTEILGALGNVTVFESPLSSRTMVPAIRSALRARQHQYEMRDLLAAQKMAVERMDLLAEVAGMLQMSSSPENIVESVFRKIAGHLNLEIYQLYLRDDKTQELRLAAQQGLPDDGCEGNDRLAFHDSICRNVAEQKKRIVAEKVQQSVEAATAHIRALGVSSYACFPLLANGRLIGTLSFGIRRRERLEHEEVAMLETVCNQVALALERRRTEEALQELNQVLEKRVGDRTAQLQEINDQMESFTYSISHDLRAPLRAIRGFAQALIEDYGGALDETGRDFLNRMGTGADRLDRLIQDLLQYSRLSRSTLTFETIDLDTAVKQALEQLSPEIRALQAAVEIQRPLPSVLGHGPTLEQVLVNLFGNAVKFVSPGVQPRLRIWGVEGSEMARLWIKDNGIGIATDQHERIFGVFERLHGAEAYPGTGIGLAIVAKGVERMGGAVGVESVPGEGSQFWIELPRASGSKDGAKPAVLEDAPIRGPEKEVQRSSN